MSEESHQSTKGGKTLTFSLPLTKASNEVGQSF